MKTAREILESLNALEIRRRLDDLVSEEKALRVLLRAATRRGASPHDGQQPESGNGEAQR
jgi:hypothetical protein